MPIASCPNINALIPAGHFSFSSSGHRLILQNKTSTPSANASTTSAQSPSATAALERRTTLSAAAPDRRGGLQQSSPSHSLAHVRTLDEPSPRSDSSSRPKYALKHARSGSSGPAWPATNAERTYKRPRARPRHTLDPSGSSTATEQAEGSTSPLFFSRTPRQRLPRLRTSSSPEAGAAMLNGVRGESGPVTTAKLARGSLSNSSPPWSSTTPTSRATLEKQSFSASPDPCGKMSPGVQILGTIGIIEFLEQDERPTFIIDVANPVNFNPGSPLQIIFANASLRAYPAVLDMVTGETDLESPGIAVTNDFPEFKRWALSFVKNNESLDVCLPSFLYEGVTWTCSTLRKRLRFISGSGLPAGGATSSSLGAPSASSMLSERHRGANTNGSDPSPRLVSHEPSDYFGDIDAQIATLASNSPQPLTSSPGAMNASILSPGKPVEVAALNGTGSQAMMNTRYPESSSFDWTRLPMSAALPRHIQFARSVDWAATPLGPIETWSFDLRAMCNMIMGCTHPAAMYWGDDFISIYNEAYILLAGQKHPTLMGQAEKEAWPEIWPDIEDIFLRAKHLGHSTYKDDDCMFLQRNGFLEEAYFSWSIIPLVGEDGSVVGLYNPAFEKTRRKIAERRMLTLREVGEKAATAREVKGFWAQVLKGLEFNEYDVPFALLYSVTDDAESDITSMQSRSVSQAPLCVLEGTLGVPKGHGAAVTPLDLRTTEEGFAPYLREAMKTNGPVLLTTEEGTLSYDLIENLEWRGFGDPCRAAVVCPIHPTTGDSILGFLVMGVNPRRPYDDDYSLFIQLLSRQLATSMASVVLFEEEIRRGQRAARLAALDRQELSKLLDIRTQEAMESETKFTHISELVPVGIFTADSTGRNITYCNDSWWEITQHPRADNSADSWMDSIMDDDREGVRKIWQKTVDEKAPVTCEFRFKTPWRDRNRSKGDTWVLMSAYPEKDDNGGLKSVFGSLTNISQQKLAEDFQKQRMQEAIEMKRQQENFIDMTSHEMRNPLSAILQCADEISTSLTYYRSVDEESKSMQRVAELFESSIDAAQTIALCAQHQKRIVDDILTLSKLDSALLIVTPVSVQPISVVQRALKMFEGEMETNDIAMEFHIDGSYKELNVEWVKLDPSRLLQVLINLMANAIKFTRVEKRTIIVSVGASKTRPQSMDPDVSYFPTRSNRKELAMDEEEWGIGEKLYLKFAVQDTGRGLDENEMSLLFQRFSQTSPRTHVQYGGSGLGLFISRELTELQGGEIGVSSERGKGSKFAFFIKARQTDRHATDPSDDFSLKSLRRNSSNSSSQAAETKRQHAAKNFALDCAAVDETARSSLTPSSSTSTASMFTPTLSTSTTTSSATPSLTNHPTTTTTKAPPLTILIVEDNLVNQRVLEKQLRKAGFTTLVANHGGEALAVLENSRFWTGREQTGADLNIILMDLEMPVMDGLSCTRRVRELEKEGTVTRHVPIIAVTANARGEQVEMAMGTGMDDVVSKPFRIPELIPKIEELVARSNSKKEGD